MGLAAGNQAKIGDTEYATLQNALDAAVTGDTIVMLCDVDVGTGYSKFYDSRNKSAGIVTNLTLDLGGYTLSGSSTRVIQIAGTGFTIKNTGTSSSVHSAVTISRGTLTLGEKLTLIGQEGVYLDPASSDATVTVDGATISGSKCGAYVEGSGTIEKHVGIASLIVKSGSVTGDEAGIEIWGAQNANAGTPSVTVESGEVSGGNYGIAGNGKSTCGSTSITISGGTVKGTNANESTGIYHPQRGTLTVTGGTVSGLTGIEIHAGGLVISGGTIKGGTETPTIEASGNGSEVKNVGIAIAQSSAENALSVSISGDSTQISGGYALAQADPQNNNSDNVSVKVTGGDFSSSKSALYSEDLTGFVTSGTFNTDPAAYVQTASDVASLTSGSASVYAVGKSIDSVRASAAGVNTLNGETVAAGAENQQHSYSDSWIYDEESHWHQCTTCEEIADKATHSLSDWITEKDATTSEEGSRYRVCTVCGYKTTESIEKLPQTGDESYPALWVLLLAFAAAGLFALTVGKRARTVGK